MMDTFLVYVGGTMQGSDISRLVEGVENWKQETFNRPVPGIRHSAYSVESFIGTAERLTVQAEKEFGNWATDYDTRIGPQTNYRVRILHRDRELGYVFYSKQSPEEPVGDELAMKLYNGIERKLDIKEGRIE